MAWYRCGNGGGGIATPTTSWRGTLVEYKALVTKDNTKLYDCIYGDIVPSATFVGGTQISPVDISMSDYEVFADECTIGGGVNANTGFQWFNGNDFEIEFSLGSTSFSGTQVFLSNSTNGWNFNIIVNGSVMKLYDPTHNQEVFDSSISANTPYYIRRSGNTISIYKGDTLLITTSSPSSSLTSTLVLFNWNSGYYFVGKVNYVKAKYTT